MDNNFKVSITGIIDKIDDKILKQWDKQKKAILVEVKFDINSKAIQQNQEDMKKRIAKILSMGGNVQTTSKIPGDISENADLSKAIVQYRTKLGIVKEIWKTEGDGKTLRIQERTLTDGLLKTEKEITKEIVQRVAEQNKLNASAASQLKSFNKKQGSYAPGENLTAAQGIASQLEFTLSKASRVKTPQGMEIFTKRVQELSSNLKVAESGLEKVDKASQGMGKSTKTLGEHLSSSAKQFVYYQIAIRGMYEALNQLRLGVQYIKDLDKEMTGIQMITGQSDASINKLAMSYNKLGSEMGVSTLEIAKGSLEFIRQGKTAEETALLIKNSTQLSKLANMDSAASSEALTSIMNGFKMEVEETTDVVNKLISIDNIAATSASELAKAMQYTASAAQITGVDFDHLAAYIGTISSVTRLSAESIGQSMKTIMLRMTAIKNMDAFDAEGESINKVEESLKNVGVQLRDGNGQFRDLQDVLDELAGKWETLNKEDQLFIAQQIGGVRQADKLLALLGNEAEIRKQLNAEKMSAGLADERYLIYLESVEAAQNKFTASWEKLWQATIESGFISWLYESGVAVLDLVTALGGLKTVLALVIAGFVYFEYAKISSIFSSMTAALLPLAIGLKALVAELFSAIGAQELFNLVANVNPYILLASSIALVVGGLVLFTSASKRAREEISRINANITDMESKLSSLQSDKKSLNTLIESYEDLRKISKKTTEQEKEFLDVQNSIKSIVPLVSGKFDELGNFLIDAGTSMDDLTESMDRNIERQERLIQLENKKKISSNVDIAIESARTLEESLKVYENYDKKLTEGALLREQYLQGASDNIEENRILMENTIADMTAFYKNLDESGQREFIRELGQDVDGKKIADQILKAIQDGIDSSPNKPEVEIKAKIDLEAEFTKLTSNSDFDKLVKQTVEMLKDIANKKKDAIQEEIKSLKESFDLQKQGLQDIFELQKRNYEEQKKNMQREHEDFLNNLQVEFEALERSYNDQMDSLKQLYDQETKNRDNAKKAIQDELDGYLKIISAQERSLNLKKAEDDYNRNKAKKEQDLAGLEAQILALSFDNSAEGIARRLELEAQAAELRTSLTEDALDRQYELEQQALEEERQRAEEEAQLRIQALEQEQEIADQEYEMRLLGLEDALEKAKLEYEENKRISDQEYEMRLRDMEDKQEKSQQEYEMNIRRLEDQYAANEANKQKEIDLLDKYLSEEGLLNKEAMDKILDENSNVYQELMDWNKLYGSGIESDIVSIWDAALVAVNAYKTAISEIPDVPTPDVEWEEYWNSHYTPTQNPQPSDDGVIHSHHSGIEKGTIGGKKLKSSEEFIKAMKGEVVITPNQMNNFTKRVLPSMMGQPESKSLLPSINSGGTFEKLFDIVVNGNLDKSTIPDLERLTTQIVDRINKGMQQRGMLRNTNLNAI